MGLAINAVRPQMATPHPCSALGGTSKAATLQHGDSAVDPPFKYWGWQFSPKLDYTQEGHNTVSHR